MVISINDKIRNKYLNDYSSDVILVKLEQENIEDNELILRLLLSDYYKYMFFEDASNSDFKLSKSVDELINDCIKDKEYFIDVIENAKAFNSLYTVSKIIIMEKIAEYNQDNNFMELSKLHLLDKIIYQFSYNLEEFKNYYKDFITKSDEKNYITDVSVFIANRLFNYKTTNYNKFREFVLEFIKVYYKWAVFVEENFGKNFLYKEDYIFLEMIKYCSLETLINYSENNFQFLSTLLENYLYYSTMDKEISDNIVEEYFYNNVDEKIQKKLNLKRD